MPDFFNGFFDHAAVLLWSHNEKTKELCFFVPRLLSDILRCVDGIMSELRAKNEIRNKSCFHLSISCQHARRSRSIIGS